MAGELWAHCSEPSSFSEERNPGGQLNYMRDPWRFLRPRLGGRIWEAGTGAGVGLGPEVGRKWSPLWPSRGEPWSCLLCTS